MGPKYASYFLLAYRNDIGMGAGVATDNDKNKGHFIQDFIDKIKYLPTGTYKVVNGEIVFQ